MDSIDGFLERFKRIVVPEETSRKRLVEVLKKEGLDLGIDSVKVKNKVAYLKINPTEKSFVFLNKQRILDEINELEEGLILDIR